MLRSPSTNKKTHITSATSATRASVKLPLLHSLPTPRKDGQEIRNRIKTQGLERGGLAREGILYGVHCQRLIVEEAQNVSLLFERIDVLRRENGQIWIDGGDEKEEQSEIEEVPYNPELREMNE